MNELIAHFIAHHDHLLFAVGSACLLLELGLLGISGPLLFISLGCFATGILVSINIVHGWELELLLVGLFTAISTVGLWMPLKRFQNSGGGPDTSSDMIGKSLPVTLEINHDQGRVSYSGIEWQARLDSSATTPIPVSTRALVVGVDGSLLLVRAN